MNSPRGDEMTNHDYISFIFKKDQIKVTSLVETESSWVTLHENLLSPNDSAQLLEELSKDLPWNVETDQFGPQSRPTCYFADPQCTFSYVGLTLDSPSQWHPTVQKLKQQVTLAVTDQWRTIHNNLSSSDASPLTACLVNLYPQGEGFIPWHYDEIRAHGKHKIVASLSLGGPRRFQLRTRVDPSRNKAKDSSEAKETNDSETEENKPRMVADLWLPSGSLLLMMGDVQENYEHCLPLDTEHHQCLTEKNNNGNKPIINPLRISLTFRSIVAGYEENRQVATDSCCT